MEACGNSLASIPFSELSVDHVNPTLFSSSLPWGNPSISIIPCYDGRMLAGVQKVAKDGLSVISIKQSHRNCQFSIDPITKLPQLSCTQGIKARNSFWNLHKPDLRKVKGLECATSESVTQMLKAHSAENAGKPTYRRKIFRLLGSLVTKKTISRTKICVLKNENSWPLHTCVLSSLCKETEIKQNGIVGTQTLSTEGFADNIEDNNRDQIANASIIGKNSARMIENKACSFKSDYDTSLPTSSTPYGFDFGFQNIDNMFSGSNTTNIKTSYRNCKDLEIDDASNQMEPFSVKLPNLNLKRNSSQVKISISSELVSISQTNESCIEKNNVTADENSFANDRFLQKCENSETTGSTLHKENEIKNDPTNPPVDMMQSVITDMLKDMKDIEDYVSAYISSFCILEEEFDNYAAIKSSSEVVSHFLSEMQSSDKVALLNTKAENCLNDSSNQNVSSYCYWEDEAAPALFDMEANAKSNHYSKVFTQNSDIRDNTALVPLTFFENLWTSSLKSFSNDDFLQYECFNSNATFPQYYTSTSTYDPTVLEEAETLVSAVDAFLNGCFYSEQSNRGQNVPCIITELDDDHEESFDWHDFNDRENYCDNVNERIISNQQILNTRAEWNDPTRVLQPYETTCSAVSQNDVKYSKTNEDSANFSNSMIKRGYENLVSSSESNTKLTPGETSSDTSSRYELSFEASSNKSSLITGTYQVTNQKLDIHTFNKNSESFKTENPTLTGQQKSKDAQFCKVGSPLNLQKTRSCSSEYRRNSNDKSVNSLEENIKSEISGKNSNRGRSRFVCVQEDSNDNSNYLFSSPNVQLNLTNPLSNNEKK